MLNKRVCVNCINTCGRKGIVWSENDDWQWKQNRCVCPFERGFERGWRFTSTKESAPDHCNYQLEHLMSESEPK